jgi:hypothetical protein
MLTCAGQIVIQRTHRVLTTTGTVDSGTKRNTFVVHFWLMPKSGGKVDDERPTQVGRAMRELGVHKC